jgi:hypothetical protein
MTSGKFERMKSGFDEHTLESGVEMENWYSDGSSRVGLRKKLKA